MGPKESQDRVAQHLHDLRVETRAWLEYERMSETDKSDQDMLRAELGLAPPEPPEPLSVLRRLKAFNMHWYDGGYVDQPHLLMREMEAVLLIEQEFERRDEANRRRQWEAAMKGK